MTDINEIMIKSDTFSFLCNCNGRFILIYVTPDTLEIIDQIGFLSDSSCYTQSFLSFLALYSKSRILLSNPPSTDVHCNELHFYSIYFHLRENGQCFSQIFSTSC